TGAPVSADIAINVDVEAPTFTVDAGVKTGLRTGGAGPDDRDPQMTNAFKRNEVVTVAVGSDAADLKPQSMGFTVKGVDAGTQTPFALNAASGCGQSHCWTATVDLATVEMWALRGKMTLTTTGRDNAGNLGQGTIQIPVTRFKWSRTVPSSAAISA